MLNLMKIKPLCKSSTFRYTEHSTVGLAQQWDQLDQLGMRMQHNLEQQIQARYVEILIWTTRIKQNTECMVVLKGSQILWYRGFYGSMYSHANSISFPLNISNITTMLP
jgi:hypothetical protein